MSVGGNLRNIGHSNEKLPYYFNKPLIENWWQFVQMATK